MSRTRTDCQWGCGPDGLWRVYPSSSLEMSSAKLMLEHLCIVASHPIAKVVSFVQPMLRLRQQMCTVSWAVPSDGHAV